MLGYANSPEEGSSARKMARDTAGLDLSFKHTEDRGHREDRDDLDEEDEDSSSAPPRKSVWDFSGTRFLRYKN